MTGVHGLEHVQRLRAAALSDDDPVGSHTERVADKVADPDLACSFRIGRARLECHDVLTLDLQFGRLLNGDQPLAVGDEVGQYIQHRRLAGAGTADHDHADLAPHQGFQEHGGVHAERSQPDEVLHDEGPFWELPDGEDRSVERERRHDGVDTGAIGKPGVHHRR